MSSAVSRLVCLIITCRRQ